MRALFLILYAALDDTNANVRYHVIEALGRLRAGQAVDALAALAESGDFSLAFPAIEALAAIGDPRVACRLVPLLDDDFLRAPALDALAELGDEEVVPALTKLLESSAIPASMVARALARVWARYEEFYRAGEYIAQLTRQTLTSASTQRLVTALQEADGADLQALAPVVGWLENPALDATLTRLLSRPQARPTIIDVLVRRGTSTIDSLGEQLRADSLETRQAAVVALGRIGDVRAVPALLEALAADDELVVAIAGALAMIGDGRAYRPLLELIAHPDPAARRGVISALNSLGHPDMASDVFDAFAESRSPCAGIGTAPGRLRRLRQLHR